MTRPADGQSEAPTNATSLRCELRGTSRNIPYDKYALMLFLHVHEQLTY